MLWDFKICNKYYGFASYGNHEIQLSFSCKLYSRYRTVCWIVILHYAFFNEPSKKPPIHRIFCRGCLILKLWIIFFSCRCWFFGFSSILFFYCLVSKYLIFYINIEKNVLLVGTYCIIKMVNVYTICSINLERLFH